ncbi:MAG: HAMP domain-containing protein, partial [Burkholderiales bacterium]|nr:HAMP domain-containing protein [Burkholderiales bacterium]
VIWLAIAALLSLAGAAVIAELINRPLRTLSLATKKIRDGDFAGTQLDERVPTAEIRDVNIGFNQMARQLAQVERDRTLMLAGISHDLRTPLARLRLEAELSVPDQDALQHMGNDIAQVEAIIAKFMDYARPGAHVTGCVELGDMLAQLRHPPAYPTRFDLTPAPFSTPLWVQADPVDLHRVIQNILENAGRYGITPGQNKAHVHIAVKVQHPWVLIGIADQGPGVDSETLPRLTQPFFRADAARSQASGAGLGLAVVDKMLARMGGSLTLTSPCPPEWVPAGQPGTGSEATRGPGLLTLISLRQLPAPGNPST